jgi:hypothetical protein
MMKKLSLSIIFACCTLAMAAQDEAIRVNYQGARPTIKDFVEAYLADLTNPTDEDDCDGEALSLYKNLKHAIECKDKGQPLEENATLTIDLKNGFLLYEQRYEDYVYRIEMCYWNEADGKHKLFADSRWSFQKGKPILGQYDGLNFYRYDNATKKMARCNTPGFDVEYLDKSYALPRTGKDITVTQWDKNGKKTQKILKWNGSGFSY